MLGIVFQIICALAGGSAIILVGYKKQSIYRWGYLLGCLNVPMWVAVEIYYCQWYLLPVNILYIIGWLTGFKNYWRKSKRKL